MDRTTPIREFTVNNSLEQVSKAIDSTLRLSGHTRFSSTKDTYRISLNATMIIISLSPADETDEKSTRCTFEVEGDVLNDHQLTGLDETIDKFISAFKGVLEGTIKVRNSATAIQSSRAKITLLYLGIATLLLLLLYWLLKDAPNQ